jgi:hypothetical protein
LRAFLHIALNFSYTHTYLIPSQSKFHRFIEGNRER